MNPEIHREAKMFACSLILIIEQYFFGGVFFQKVCILDNLELLLFRIFSHPRCFLGRVHTRA